MAKWKQNGAPANLLDRLNTIRQVDPAGKVSFAGFAFDDLLTPLVYCIEFNAATPWHERRRLCRDALFAHDPAKPLESAVFLTTVSAMERRLLSRDEKRFWVRTSVSIHGLRGSLSGSLSGVRYRFQPKSEVLSEASRELLHRAQISLGIGAIPQRYTTLWVCSRGRDAYTAGFAALDAVDTLRGIWNYSANRHNVRYSFGRRYPANAIALGPIHMIFDYKKKALEQWLHDPDFVAPVSMFDASARWLRIKTDERAIRGRLKDKWYAQLLLDAFRHYARALDDTRHDASFLRLWSVLEHLALARAASGEEACKRAAAVFRESSLVRMQLDALRHGRNEYVHANRPLDEPEICLYQLKSVVDGMFRFWLGPARWLRNEDEVRMFLQLPECTDTLRRRRAIIDSAIKHRGR